MKGDDIIRKSIITVTVNVLIVIDTEGYHSLMVRITLWIAAKWTEALTTKAQSMVQAVQNGWFPKTKGFLR